MSELITAIIAGITLLVSIIGVWLNLNLKIKEIDMKILEIEHKFKDTEAIFTKIEKNNDKIYNKLDELYKLVYQNIEKN